MSERPTRDRRLFVQRLPESGLSESDVPENGPSEGGSNPPGSARPEPGPQDSAGHAARLLAEEGLETEGPLLGALEALERLGRAAPPAPSGDLAKLLAGMRPEASAEAAPPGPEPANGGSGAVVPLVRGRRRRAAASGTLAALVLVAGIGGAAAASPALRGQLERAISAVVPVAVAPGGVEVDRTQLGSAPSPTPAAPSSPASDQTDEPADGTVAEASQKANDAGADNAHTAGKRPAQDGHGASADRSAQKRDGSAAGGQDSNKQDNGQGSGSRVNGQNNGKQGSGQDNGSRGAGQGSNKQGSGSQGKGQENGAANGVGHGTWNGAGQGSRGSEEWQTSGAWTGVGQGSRGNGWGDLQLPVRGADLWEGLGHTYGRWPEGDSASGAGGR